jgi:hypothetical protein
MNHNSLRAVVALRASALGASFQIARAICRTGWFSPHQPPKTQKGHPAGVTFLRFWWAVLDSNARPIG